MKRRVPSPSRGTKVLSRATLGGHSRRSHVRCGGSTTRQTGITTTGASRAWPHASTAARSPHGAPRKALQRRAGSPADGPARGRKGAAAAAAAAASGAAAKGAADQFRAIFKLFRAKFSAEMGELWQNGALIRGREG